MSQIKYKRILLKLSGEALAGEQHRGLDYSVIHPVCEAIKQCHELGVQIGLVIGGGFGGTIDNCSASGTVKASYYGASSAKNMGELNMSDLTMYEGTLVGQTLTIATTEEKPYIWFASRQPLIFSQCGFEASLNTNKLGDLYYYWSDELVAGDDNEYQIKLKE